jgi:hypothetical protein
LRQAISVNPAGYSGTSFAFRLTLQQTHDPEPARDRPGARVMAEINRRAA